jgi:hypothetical protein
MTGRPHVRITKAMCRTQCHNAGLDVPLVLVLEPTIWSNLLNENSSNFVLSLCQVGEEEQKQNPDWSVQTLKQMCA